jgi:NDP-sugar pyrophosphorylase family protein
VANRPLLAHAFERLATAGIERYVVNTHWHAERYAEFFPDRRWDGRPITFVEERPEVLETAGGIWNARALLEDGPFVVYNGDIFSDLPLGHAIAHHRGSGNEVTLVLRSHGGNRNVAFDESTGRVLDLRRALRRDVEPRHMFTGIYVVEPGFIARIPDGRKLSVVPIFHEMIRAGAKLGGIVIDDGMWWDLGTRTDYLAVHAALAGRGAPWIAKDAAVAPDARISGATAIARGARIGSGAELRDCIIWEAGEVAPGARLARCIVADGPPAAGEHVDADFASA